MLALLGFQLTIRPKKISDRRFVWCGGRARRSGLLLVSIETIDRLLVLTRLVRVMQGIRGVQAIVGARVGTIVGARVRTIVGARVRTIVGARVRTIVGRL